MSFQVLYVSGGSALSRLFERALKPLGYDNLVYLPTTGPERAQNRTMGSSSCMALYPVDD